MGTSLACLYIAFAIIGTSTRPASLQRISVPCRTFLDRPPKMRSKLTVGQERRLCLFWLLFWHGLWLVFSRGPSCWRGSGSDCGPLLSNHSLASFLRMLFAYATLFEQVSYSRSDHHPLMLLAIKRICSRMQLSTIH